jgi:hypothetical protein
MALPEHTKPKIEVVRQNDGRDLLLYDGIVIGLITVVRDEVKFDTERRIGLACQALSYGDFKERVAGGNSLDASIGGRSSHRFKDEAEYDAWINDDHPEEG